jgi:uncharacterized damage-inducible protein DinB
MDRAAIGELFRFIDHGWGVYRDVIRPLGDDRLVAPAPGSGWPALADALVHLNWAYIRWLADPGGTTEAPVERVRSWDELEAYRHRVFDPPRERLSRLTEAELATPHEMNVDGTTMRYRPADIFVHALLHERQHHGDLNTLLFQLGVEPPIVEFRFSLAPA